MIKSMKQLLRELVLFMKGMNRAVLEDSVSALQLEYSEMLATFVTIVLGPLVGVKTVSPILSMELLEALKDEIKVLESRAVRGDDVLGDLMSSLGGEW
ncbi:MAG: hypothetical protein QXR92_05315 [Fervidicoccaceae archaeon]